MSNITIISDKSSQDCIITSSRKITTNKRFLDNEARFNKVLCGEISQRHINVRPKDFYQQAGLTSPTFYLHYHNSNEVRKTYESSLEQELENRIPITARKTIVLTILPIFIIHNQQYFLAVHRGRDHHLLTKIIIKYRLNLVDQKVNDRSFYAYAGSMETVIACWLEFDELNLVTAKRCTRDLINLPVPKIPD